MKFFLVILLVASTCAAPSALTWNEFLNAKGIFPAEHEQAPVLERLTKSSNSDHEEAVVRDLEKLLEKTQVVDQLYENYLNKLFDRENTSKLRTSAHKAVFKNRLVEIARHNLDEKAGRTTWTKGVTPFSHLTVEEFSKRLGLPKDLGEVIKNLPRVEVPLGQAPSSINWTDQGMVTRVKNQDPCNDCFIFASTAVIESNYAINSGQLIDLSVQQVLDCCPVDPTAGNGCWTPDVPRGCPSPGFAEGALTYDAIGLATWSDYPYQGANGNCNDQGVNKVVKPGQYSVLYSSMGHTETDFANAVGTYGPSTISIDADGLQDYAGGVLAYPTCTTNTNHMVTAVGYTPDTWIIKNSWGGNWGELGYFQAQFGVNQCGLGSHMIIMTSPATAV